MVTVNLATMGLVCLSAVDRAAVDLATVGLVDLVGLMCLTWIWRT